MRKPADLRLNKKIIIPSAIVIVLLMISTAGTASYSKKQIQDASAKSQSEAKQILNDSVKSGTILYIDSRYHYLTKALINLS